jgi:nitric oxide reductase NorE protein
MSPAKARPATRGRDPFAGLPGHPMMWILIGSELLVFGGALIAFSAARIGDPRGFAQAQDHLDRLTGLANLLVLVTSGLFAAFATLAAREGRTRRCRLHLALAGALGLVFLAFKAREYAHDLSAGLTIDSGAFFTLYFLITGFHALHVALGLIILAIVAARPSVLNVETGAAFWHMVDLVWILVFPVIYLVR